MRYGENHYPAAQTLREARAALRLLAGDSTRVVAQIAAQESCSVNILARVYARGTRAWGMGHAAGATAEEWGLARVLEFVQGGVAARTVDRDLAEPSQVLAPVHVEIAVSPNAVGVMLPIPLAVAQKYALDVEGAEPPSEFHLTLVYLGNLPPETITAVREAVRSVAAQYAPFEGTISGIGRFNAPEKDPLYLSVDAVRLTAFREAIFAALPPTQQNHGFTPHITLAYLPKDAETPKVPIYDDVLWFDRIEVWIGGTREPYLLTGKPALEYRTKAELAAGVSAADKAYISTPGGQVEAILREADETPVCSHAKEFHRLVNMTPAEIRKWSQDPRAKCASFPSTLRRLPALAALKEKPVSTWTKRDCSFAARVVNFNSRMDGMRKEHGNTDKINVSLRNWGRAVGEPPKECPKDTKHKKR